MPKMGADYQKKVFFLPLANEPGSGELLHISHGELKTRLFGYITEYDAISRVSVYTHNLYSVLPTGVILYHAFVLLETTSGWFWSVEKNDEGVFVQRSKNLFAVREFLRHKERPSIINVISDSSVMPMRKFVHELWMSNAITSEYNIVSNNCKHFAKDVFDKVATSKSWTKWV